MIKSVKMFDGEFKGQRTAYSGNCMFVAILTNPNIEYDHEVIGEAIYPEGFGAMEPPGPSSGFGSILLTEEEENGKVEIAGLKDRKDDNGKKLTTKKVKESLEEYIDGFFIVDEVDKCIKQVSFDEFYQFLNKGNVYKVIHFCEYMPD
jgi:hypothetical protein